MAGPCSVIYKGKEIEIDKFAKHLIDEGGLTDIIARLKPRKPISAEESSNFANLTEDNDGNFVFFHKGGNDYETIKKSTGKTLATSKEEAAALGRAGGAAMYYTGPEGGESMVKGSSKYAVKVPKDKVYDFNTDSENLIEEARKRFEEDHPGISFSPNDQLAYMTKVAGERGYDMVVAEWDGKTRAQTTKEFKPHDVEVKEGDVIKKPFKEDYVSNDKKGYESVIPETKDQKLKQVYDAINNERNSQNRYDKLYHLKEDNEKMNQAEITKMIDESDISQELKDKYKEAVEFKEEKRRSEPPAKFVGESVKVENAPNGHHLNIGLVEGRTDKLMSAEDVLSKLPKDVKVISHSEIQGTEPSISVETSRPLTSSEMGKFLEDTKQQAIAQLSNGRGILYDVKRGTPEGWGEFNPELFFKQDGKPLKEAEIKTKPQQIGEGLLTHLGITPETESTGTEFQDNVKPQFKIDLNENLSGDQAENVKKIFDESLDNPNESTSETINIDDTIDPSIPTQKITIDKTDKRPESGLMNKLRIPLNFIFGKSVGLGMSDTLTTGERTVDVMNPETGKIEKKTIREEGGIGYPFKSLMDLIDGKIQQGKKVFGWASVGEGAGTAMINAAKKANKITGKELKQHYFDNLNLTEEQKQRINESIPDDKDYGLVSIYKMGNDGILSNEAHTKEAFRQIETSLNESEKELFFKLAKERLLKLKWEGKENYIKLINSANNFVELENVLHGKDSKLSLGSKASIIQKVFLSSEKTVSKETGNKLGELLKSKGISIESVSNAIEEPTMKGIDKGQPMILLAIDPESKVIKDENRERHNNYPYGVEGFPVGLFNETTQMHRISPEMMDNFVKTATTTVDENATLNNKKVRVSIYQDADGNFYAQEGKGNDKFSIKDKKGVNLFGESKEELFSKLKKEGYKLSKSVLEERYTQKINGTTFNNLLQKAKTGFISIFENPKLSAQEKLVKYLQKAFPGVSVEINSSEYNKLEADFKAQKIFNKDGKSYGFVKDGRIYLNPEYLNNNTPIHEFGHVWNSFAKNYKPEVYSKGVELVTGSKYHDFVLNDSQYQKIIKAEFGADAIVKDKNTGKFVINENSKNVEAIKDAVADEALAKAIGDKGELFVNEAQKKSFKDWLDKLYNAIKKVVGFESMTPEQFQNLNLNQFVDAAAKEILSGKKVSDITSSELSKITKTSAKFSVESQDSQIKNYIDSKRKAGESDADIKAGIEFVADKLGLTPEKINDLMGGKKPIKKQEIDYKGKTYFKNEKGTWVNSATGNEIKGIGPIGKELINNLEKTLHPETPIHKEGITPKEEIESLGKIQGGTVSWEKSVDDAMKTMKSEAKPNESTADVAERKIDDWGSRIEKEISETGKSTFNPTEEDLATMSYHRTNLLDQLKSLEKDTMSTDKVTQENALKKSAELTQKLLNVDYVLSESGKVAGRSFYIRQMIARMDSEGGMVIRRMDIIRSQGGEPLTKEQEIQLAKIQAEEKELANDYDKMPKYSQEDFDAELNRRIKEVENKNTKEDLGTKARNLAKDIRLGKKLALPDWAVAEGAKERKTQGLSYQEVLAKSLEIFADVHDATKDFARAVEKGFEHLKGWYVKNGVKLDENDIKSKFSNYAESNTKTKSITSDETKRKSYINRLVKDIESLDEQINNGERKFVSKEDKYKNDAEIENLRDIKKSKQQELSKIDPTYSERVKLERDFKSAQESLDRYQRKIDESDFTKEQKQSKNIDKKLQDLRNDRDLKRKQFLKAKSDFEKSNKIKEVETKKDILDNIKSESKDSLSKVSVAKGSISKLVDTYIGEGLRGKELFDQMNTDLREIYPNITDQQVREAFLKTGEFKLESKNVIDATKAEAKAELNGIAKLETQLEDIKQNKLKEKNPVKRRKLTEEEVRLRGKLDAVLKSKGIEIERASSKEVEVKKQLAKSFNENVDSIIKTIDQEIESGNLSNEDITHLNKVKSDIESTKVNENTSEKIDNAVERGIKKLDEAKVDVVGNDNILNKIAETNVENRSNSANNEQDVLLSRHKTNLERKIKSSEDKINNGEFEDKPRTQRLKTDAEAIKLEMKARAIDTKYRRMRDIAAQKNMKWWEKGLSLGQSFLVNQLIGSLRTSANVLAAGLVKQPLNTLTESTFGLVSHTLFPELSKRAGAEGKISLLKEKQRYRAHYAKLGPEGMKKIWSKTERNLKTAEDNYKDNPSDKNKEKLRNALVAHQSNFIYDWIGSDAWKDSADVFLKGASTLEEMTGKGEKIGWKDMTGLEKTEMLMGAMGASHGYFKNFSARAEFAASFVSRLDQKSKLGVDISDPNIIIETIDESLVDFMRGKYQEDNYATSAMKSIGQALENPKNPKWEKYGKVASALFKAKYPILRTGVNIGREAIQEYLLGSMFGSAVHGKAVVKGIFNGVKNSEPIKESITKEIKKMPSDKVDLIFRCYRKGGLGLVMAGLAAMGYLRFGGFTADKDRKRKEGELAQGELELFGHNLGHEGSKPLSHLAFTYPALIIANNNRIMAKEGEDMDKIQKSVTSNISSMLRTIPVFNEGMSPLYSPSVPYGRAAADISKLYDINEEGELIGRDKSTLKNRFLQNIGLRKMTPKTPEFMTKEELRAEAKKQKEEIKRKGAN